MTAISSMDRRTLLQRALLLVGAAAMPGVGEVLAAAAKAGEPTLDQKHFALLAAVADTIVPKTDTPGALETGVPQQVDTLLHTWASPKRRAELIGALDAIDALAQQRQQKSFAALSPSERHELLAAHDIAALQPIPRRGTAVENPLAASRSVADPNYGKVKQEPVQSSPLSAGPSVADPAYAKLKELIVVVFYISETAMTHDLRYVHSPGEWRPSIPLTPETRAEGGVGPL